MKLSKDVVQLFELFNRAGFKLYIIGGAVRDYLLNREIKDYDFCTDAKPWEMEEILKGYNIDTYQSNLGSVKIHLNNNVYEITSFRREFGVKDFRYPNKIEFVSELKEDVLRRDFTINSLAYSINDGIVDCLNGISDLNNGKIKFIKDCKESINEDPIRLIRALRFSKLLDFKISDEDLNVFLETASLVNDLGKIKYDELFKLFEIKGCKKFLLKYFNIYKNSYPILNNCEFINVLNSDLDESCLKYVLLYFINDLSLMNKKDQIIIRGLNNIKILDIDLYNTKLLMIEYKEYLDKILVILEAFGKDVTNIKNNIDIIKSEKHCLYVNDLDISYIDLENLEIEVKYYGKVFKYLLNLVLVDYKLNRKEKLIELIKSKKGGF